MLLTALQTPALRRATLVLTTLLAGCSSPPLVPTRVADLALPRSVHVIKHQSGKRSQDALLVAQQEPDGGTRWLLFDPLGMPLSRQTFQNGQWRNDGFIRPNAEARTLFSALMFAWTPADQLAFAYPAGAWNQRQLTEGAQQRQLIQNDKPLWTVTWQPDDSTKTLTITASDGAWWKVSPLETQQ